MANTHRERPEPSGAPRKALAFLRDHWSILTVTALLIAAVLFPIIRFGFFA
ncbi:MAG: hypothetical protein ACRD0P_14340 [Stackebrandtia sp.]